MPWDDYKPVAICNDGRFDELASTYTVEFWIKKELDLLGEVNLFEFLKDNEPVERIFLNEEGELSFTAGNGQQVYKYNNLFPASKAHYHIALVKSDSAYCLFINGSKRIDFGIKEKTQRPHLVLCRPAWGWQNFPGKIDRSGIGPRIRSD